jgi:undecaprenyl-diphosphatase
MRRLMRWVFRLCRCFADLDIGLEKSFPFGIPSMSLSFASLSFASLSFAITSCFSPVLFFAPAWPADLLAGLNAAEPGLNLVTGIFQAFVLGIVQGITEFLPISSTAHLLLFNKVLGWQLGDKWFVDAIQFGSVVAVVMFFWQLLRQVFSGAWTAFQSKDYTSPDWKLVVGIALGTIPALAGGLALKILEKKEVIPDGALDTPTVIACAALLMACLLGAAEKFGLRRRDFDSVEIKDGILVGLGQMIALIPGASRSGSTLTAGMFLGLKRDVAARFSFLLGLPTLTIATLVQMTEVKDHLNMAIPLLVGTVSSFAFSYLSISWLLKFLQSQSNWVFVWYRLALGTTLLVMVSAQVLK